LIRHPSTLKCTVVVSIQNLTCSPVRRVPSQNCCGPMARLDGGGCRPNWLY
jgi:hypothetical protein